MNSIKILAIRKKLKNSYNITVIGIFCITLSFFINPFTIQRMMVPDGNIQSIDKIRCIFLFEGALFCVGVYVYLKSKHLWNKETWIRIIMLVSFILACWIFLEYISYIGGTIVFGKDYFKSPVKPNYGLITKNLYNIDIDKNVGYVLKKNNTHHAIKAYSNGNSIYSVTYATDEYRRRTVNQTYSPANKHLILFGDSFTYGEGLNDQDTLQYQLQQVIPQYNIYNYAVHGYGPQQILAILESKRLPQEVFSLKGVAVYVFVEPNSIRRLIGSTATFWTFDMHGFPFYDLDKNKEIIRKGDFISDRTLLSFLYRNYTDLRNNSPFLQLLNLNFPVRIRNRDIFLIYKLIEKSKRLYEEQFSGTFYVLIHPLTEYNNNVVKLIRLLVDHHIPVLQYPLDPTSKEYRIIGDEHPNEKTNQLLSVYMSSVFTKSNNPK